MDQQLLRASPFGGQAGQTVDSLAGDFTRFQIDRVMF
jgi:hypothetical protein